MIAVGTKAPAFSLMASNGQTISLDSLAGKNAVIVFYPLNHTPG
jgi:thioredoxin-dependent peroxiredoxin